MNTHTVSPIVGCVDFSPNVSQAAAAAAAFASIQKAPLVLVHVADEFNAHAESPAELEEFLKPIRQRLAAEANRLNAGQSIVTAELLHGCVAEEAILGFLTQRSAQLVVVSAVSKTPFDRWTMGAVSERLAQSSSTATLVVRASAPFEAWARGERSLKVFVAADFSASAEAGMQWVAELRQLGPCEVTIGYVNDPMAERERLGIQTPAWPLENTPEVQQVLERDLQEKVIPILGKDAHVRVRGNVGRVDVPLINLAYEAHADLLVVGSHQRHGWDRLRRGSTSCGILRHAPMSVACVPAAAVPGLPATTRLCHRVLAAADLSQHDGLAVPLAYSVVREGGTVHLVHVVPSSTVSNARTSGVRGAPRSRRSVSLRRVYADGRLRSLIPPEAAVRGITTEIEVVENDDAATAICQTAEAANADIVCVGAHARPGAVARMMGSVSLKVLQHCRRPVLVVWPNIP